jgi:hypothetical protein
VSPTITTEQTMSTIDKPRIAAVRKLELLGYTFAGRRDARAHEQ